MIWISYKMQEILTNFYARFLGCSRESRKIGSVYNILKQICEIIHDWFIIIMLSYWQLTYQHEMHFGHNLILLLIKYMNLFNHDNLYQVSNIPNWLWWLHHRFYKNMQWCKRIPIDPSIYKLTTTLKGSNVSHQHKHTLLTCISTQKARSHKSKSVLLYNTRYFNKCLA